MQDSIDSLNHYDSSSHTVLSITEERMLGLYRQLNEPGQSKVYEYTSDLVASGNYSSSGNYDCLLAAHDRTDVEASDEEKKHDIDILSDDNF